ncbi:amino acid--tRNA ligase-related protein, partial [Mycoplasmopsis synoviae]
EFKSLSKNQIKAKSYDLFLNGFELGSGSARIYSKEVQELIFESLGMDKKEQEEKFGFFLKAFDYALRPHCGIRLALDRLLMIVGNKRTIRDVIAFRKNAKNKDVFTKAPS